MFICNTKHIKNLTFLLQYSWFGCGHSHKLYPSTWRKRIFLDLLAPCVFLRVNFPHSFLRTLHWTSELWSKITAAIYVVMGAVRQFFREAKLIYGAVSSCCTNESCPVMSAGQRLVFDNFANNPLHVHLRPLFLLFFGHLTFYICRYEYRWFDGTSAVTLSAPVYVRALFSWVEKLLKCKSLFPTEPGRDSVDC